jgi:hypothetical protein
MSLRLFNPGRSRASLVRIPSFDSIFSLIRQSVPLDSAERIEQYLSYRVEQSYRPGPRGRDVCMDWAELKYLARQLCTAIEGVLQLGVDSPATKALFEINIKNHCWKLTKKHPIRSGVVTTTVECNMEDDNELSHKVVKDTDADSFDGHASKMNFYAFAGISSKIKMSSLIPSHRE